MIDYYYPSKIFIKQVVDFLKEGTNLLLYLALFMLLLLRPLLLLLLLQRLLGPLRVLLEILVPELKEQLVGDLDHLIDVQMILDVLEVLEDGGEVVVDDDLLAGHDDGDGKETDELEVVLRREDAFPDSESVEEVEVLSVEESDPSEAVEERIDLQFLQSIPNEGLNDLSRITSYDKHLADLVQFAVNPMLTLIQILDVQLNDVADGTVEHIEAG